MTAVKYFHAGMAGAPVLSGTPGSLIAVLDACLVNGFGVKTLDSLVVNNNIATATISTGHSAEIDTVVLVAGATPTSLNGQWKVTSVTTNTISFQTSGITNQTATGTINIRLAPAGWSKPFTGTNLAAYRSSDVAGTRRYLRVNDTAAQVARVVGYETMTAISTGTNQFPSNAQRSGGSYWSKSDTANASSRDWILIADSRFFYFARAFNAPGQYGGYQLTVFGDILSTRSGDAYACILSGIDFDESVAYSYSANNYWSADNNTLAELYAPRSYTGVGSSVQLGKTFDGLIGQVNSSPSGQVYNGMVFPNPEDGGMYVSPHYVFENGPRSLRGISPGFFCSPHQFTSSVFNAKDSVLGVTGLVGKALKVITVYGSSFLTPCFVDVTGPWR